MNQPVILTFLHIEFDTWYRDELATPESDQDLTTLTKVKFDCLKFLMKDFPLWKVTYVKSVQTCGSTSYQPY